MSVQQMPNKWFGFALLVHYTICPSFIKLKKGFLDIYKWLTIWHP